MKKIIKVSIGIPTYNAENNIKKLVTSLLNQKLKNFEVNKIYIFSDQSTDKTNEIVNSIKNKKVQLIIPEKRGGFAMALISLVKINTSEVMIILNDDVIIKDKFLLNKLLSIFNTATNIGLVCGNLQPLPSKNFISKSVRSGYLAYKKMGDSINSGNNIYSCDGKVMCFSKDFISFLKFPEDKSKMGNTDHYMYFLCLRNKFKFKYESKAVIYFKCPSTFQDFFKWQIRNYRSQSILKENFKEVAIKTYQMPKVRFLYYRIIEFTKNPLGSIFIFVIGLYCSYRVKSHYERFSPTWDLISTTKDIT